jgi:hypothetical protein
MDHQAMSVMINIWLLLSFTPGIFLAFDHLSISTIAL